MFGPYNVPHEDPGPYNVPHEDPDLRHELLLTFDSQALLRELEKYCQTTEADFFFNQTLEHWRVQNLLNCVQIDTASCPQLFNIFENAKKRLRHAKNKLKADKSLNDDFMQATLWLKRDATASASSMALPGHASVVLSNEMVNLMMEGKWDDEQHKAQLTGVFVHELTHILYKHCQYFTSMTRLLMRTQDGSEIGESNAQKLTAVWRLVETGFELTADRGMYTALKTELQEIPATINIQTSLELTADRDTALKTDLQEIPAPIMDLFTKLAGGNIGVPLNSTAFFKQIQLVNGNDMGRIERFGMMKDPHLPILCRLNELEVYCRAQGRASTSAAYLV
jgi:hypothetical protein